MAIGSDGPGALPTLIVIGAARCGTTSLHHYLSRHPEIGMSANKELGFFGDRPAIESGPPLRAEDLRITQRRRGTWSRGLKWYRSQFDPAERVRGESTPMYTDPWFPECAERMAGVIPDAKLIYCVRDPVERAISFHAHSRAAGHDARPPDEALSVPGGRYLLPSRYAECLRPYLDRFPRERIYVVELEDLGDARRETLASLFRFLGVDEGFWDPWFERRWNASAAQGGRRWQAVFRLRRTRWWEHIAPRAPWRSRWLVERLLRGRNVPAKPPGPSPEVRAFLRASLRDDAERFRGLTGRKFSSWQV